MITNDILVSIRKLSDNAMKDLPYYLYKPYFDLSLIILKIEILQSGGEEAYNRLKSEGLV